MYVFLVRQTQNAGHVLAPHAIHVNFAGDLHLKRRARPRQGGKLRTVLNMEYGGRSQGTERPLLEVIFAPFANTSRTTAKGTFSNVPADQEVPFLWGVFA